MLAALNDHVPVGQIVKGERYPGPVPPRRLNEMAALSGSGLDAVFVPFQAIWQCFGRVLQMNDSAVSECYAGGG